jgi:AP-3 complex subunit beta
MMVSLTKNRLKKININVLYLLLHYILFYTVVPMTPVMTPSLGGFLTPINSTITDDVREVSTSYVPLKKTTLLNSITGHGLKIEYRFTRSQHLVSSSLVNIELTFSNESNNIIKEIQIGNKVSNIPNII